jgi:Protein of unknown function (DUF3306)
MSQPEDKGGENDGGFLGRWAKRKQAVQLEAKQQTIAPLGEDGQNALQAPQTSRSKIEGQKSIEGRESEEAKLPMPSLDDVLPGGDVSMFLQKHVPDSLRNMALRKAWASDPEISSFIEMAENQWDFNNPDSIPGFSSSLEGIDIQAMVEKMFNNVAPPKPDEPQNDPIDQKVGEEDHQSEQLETAEVIIMDTNSPEKAVESSQNLTAQDSGSYVALQENTAKSGIYEPLKKRHGSALPS